MYTYFSLALLYTTATYAFPSALQAALAVDGKLGLTSDASLPDGAISGEATFYKEWADPAVSCNPDKCPDDGWCAAIPAKYMADKAGTKESCGKCIKLVYKEKAVVLRVMDTCPGCGENNIDMTVPGFEKLTGGLDLGRVEIKWAFVDCATGGSKEGSGGDKDKPVSDSKSSEKSDSEKETSLDKNKSSDKSETSDDKDKESDKGKQEKSESKDGKDNEGAKGSKQVARSESKEETNGSNNSKEVAKSDEKVKVSSERQSDDRVEEVSRGAATKTKTGKRSKKDKKEKKSKRSLKKKRGKKHKEKDEGEENGSAEGGKRIKKRKEKKKKHKEGKKKACKRCKKQRREKKKEEDDPSDGQTAKEE